MAVKLNVVVVSGSIKQTPSEEAFVTLSQSRNFPQSLVVNYVNRLFYLYSTVFCF